MKEEEVRREGGRGREGRQGTPPSEAKMFIRQSFPVTGPFAETFSQHTLMCVCFCIVQLSLSSVCVCVCVCVALYRLSRQVA